MKKNDLDANTHKVVETLIKNFAETDVIEAVIASRMDGATLPPEVIRSLRKHVLRGKDGMNKTPAQRLIDHLEENDIYYEALTASYDRAHEYVKIRKSKSTKHTLTRVHVAYCVPVLRNERGGGT